MKKIKKLLIPLLLLTLMLSGCGSAMKGDSMVESAPSYNGAFKEDFDISFDSVANGSTSKPNSKPTTDSTSSGSSDKTENVIDGAKLIRMMKIYMETVQFDDCVKSLKTKVTECGGYIQSSDLSSYYTRNQTITIRIPYDKVDTFLTGIEEYATIKTMSDETIDITLKYADIATRIDNLEKQHTRLLELLETAKDLDYIIELERRLSDIETELDSYKLEIKNYDNLVNYSTISIVIEETKHITPVKQETIFDRIKAGWSDSIYDIKESLSDLLVFVVVNIPNFILSLIYLVIILFIIKIVVKLIRKYRNKLFTDRVKDKKFDKDDKNPPLPPIDE